jgi:hypothetical protein
MKREGDIFRKIGGKVYAAKAEDEKAEPEPEDQKAQEKSPQNDDEFWNPPGEKEAAGVSGIGDQSKELTVTILM